MGYAQGDRWCCLAGCGFALPFNPEQNKANAELIKTVDINRRKKDEKKDDKPKVAMIPIPTALFLGVLLSPAVGPVMYMLYKSLWAMALK
jgi:hypothetical protein